MTRTKNALQALAVILAIGPLGTGCASSNGDIVSPPPQWNLTMSDEFDSGTSPSAELWTIETGYGPNDDGWGNDEWQLYTDSGKNVYLEDGKLVISVECEASDCGKRDGTFTSARLKTQGNFSFKYGRVLARIKPPKGIGTWISNPCPT